MEHVENPMSLARVFVVGHIEHMRLADIVAGSMGVPLTNSLTILSPGWAVEVGTTDDIEDELPGALGLDRSEFYLDCIPAEDARFRDVAAFVEKISSALRSSGLEVFCVIEYDVQPF
ncbi:hypothetical protein ACIQGZ_14495 [Streptomyces sp. NPDC092296]|uniref:hypothetical protein n=1 Tax=Streptomyces sp. NPDC092296 TaxID=3366012 RepID=UPI003815B542